MDFINYNGKSYDAYGRIYSSIGNQNFHYKFCFAQFATNYYVF